MMIIVRLGDLADFRKEVVDEREAIEDSIVRVQIRKQPSQQGRVVVIVLVASALMAGKLVLCEEVCGSGVGLSLASDLALAEGLASALGMRKELERFCDAQGLEMRAGVLEVASGC